MCSAEGQTETKRCSVAEVETETNEYNDVSRTQMAVAAVFGETYIKLLKPFFHFSKLVPRSFPSRTGPATKRAPV